MDFVSGERRVFCEVPLGLAEFPEALYDLLKEIIQAKLSPKVKYNIAITSDLVPRTDKGQKCGFVIGHVYGILHHNTSHCLKLKKRPPAENQTVCLETLKLNVSLFLQSSIFSPED